MTPKNGQNNDGDSKAGMSAGGDNSPTQPDDKFHPKLNHTNHILEQISGHTASRDYLAAKNAFDQIDPSDQNNILTMSTRWDISLGLLKLHPEDESCLAWVGNLHSQADAMIALDSESHIAWWCKVSAFKEIEGPAVALEFIKANIGKLPFGYGVFFVAAVCAGAAGDVEASRGWFKLATIMHTQYLSGLQTLEAHDRLNECGLQYRELQPLWEDFKQTIQLTNFIRKTFSFSE